MSTSKVNLKKAKKKKQGAKEGAAPSERTTVAKRSQVAPRGAFSFSLSFDGEIIEKFY